MTKYLIGSDPNSDASWSTTSGGSSDTVRPTSSDDVKFDANSPSATLTANVTCKSFDSTGYTNTLNHGAFSITSAGSVTLVSGMTYTPVSSSSWIISTTASLTTGGKLMPLISHTNGTVTLQDDLNFMDSKFMTLTLSGTNFNLNGHNINGYSATSRVFVVSGTLGTGKTLTPSGGTFSNADFRDITFSSATSLNFSAVTGGSGDCQGNTITGGGSTLTFTAPTTQNITMTTNHNYSDIAIWTSHVPLPQDSITATGFTAGTLSLDMPRLGKDIDFSGMSGTSALNAGTSGDIYGSFKLKAGKSIPGVVSYSFLGRGTHTIDVASNGMGHSLTIATIGGSYQLLSSLSGIASLNHNNGDFDWNGKNISCAGYILIAANVRRILNATGTLSLTSAPTAWAVNATNLTFDPSALTVNVAGAVGFDLLGLHWYKINFNSTGGSITVNTGTVDIINYFSTSSAKTMKINSGATLTVGAFNVYGLSGKVLTLSSTTGGVAANLVKSSGVISSDFLSIQDIHFSGGANFYAGNNSTNVSGNTGITFTAQPTIRTNMFSDEGSVQ